MGAPPEAFVSTTIALIKEFTLCGGGRGLVIPNEKIKNLGESQRNFSLSPLRITNGIALKQRQSW